MSDYFTASGTPKPVVESMNWFDSGDIIEWH